MCTSFTEHVRDFGPGCDPAGCVLPRLTDLLRARMRLRNLLDAPPSYLGYNDVGSWAAPGAFDDIAVDCYVFAFLDRLVGLRNQLRIRPNIDGLIVRNADSFLLERQRRNDPIGYAVFRNVEAATLALGAGGELAVEGTTEGRLRGSSTLRLSPSGEPCDPGALRDALDEARGWDGVLAELIHTSDAGREWAAGFLRQLRATGVSAVRVSELVGALAAQARRDWAGRHALPAGESAREGDDFATLVRLVWPDTGAADRDQWAMLRQAVPERISRLDRQQRVRDRLARVFAELVRLVDAGGPTPPTQADIVHGLGLPRETVSGDFRLLGEVISEILPRNPDG